MFSRRHVFIGVIVILLCIVLFFVYRGVLKKKEDSLLSTPENPAHEILSKNSQSFIEAEAAKQNKQYGVAREEYKQALGDAHDNVQKGLLDYLIGITYDMEGNSVETVRSLKDIASNPNPEYTSEVRAYALQYIGEIYFRYGANPEIIQTTFEGEPYSTFFVKDNPYLSYIHLFEYASEFKPLAVLELRIAEYYARQLGTVNTSPEQGKKAQAETYRSIIREKINNAERDFQANADHPLKAGFAPKILMRKGSLLSRLYNINETSFGDPEPAFQKSLELHRLKSNNSDGYALYYYALFLAKHAPDRQADIEKLLKNFTDTDRYSGTDVLKFFANEKKDVLGQKKNLALLGEKFPPFRMLLTKLGWEEKDFIP